MLDFVDPIRPRRHLQFRGLADTGQTLLYACGLDSQRLGKCESIQTN
jgi:hypothetical protein